MRFSPALGAQHPQVPLWGQQVLEVQGHPWKQWIQAIRLYLCDGMMSTVLCCLSSTDSDILSIFTWKYLLLCSTVLAPWGRHLAKEQQSVICLAVAASQNRKSWPLLLQSISALLPFQTNLSMPWIQIKSLPSCPSINITCTLTWDIVLLCFESWMATHAKSQGEVYWLHKIGRPFFWSAHTMQIFKTHQYKKSQK